MLDFLEQLMIGKLSHMAIFPADWSRLDKATMPIGRTPRLSAVARSVDESASESEAPHGQMREAVLNCEPGDRPAMLRSFMIEIVAGALGASPARIESDRSLTLMGLDSLMAVDLQTRVSKQLGCEIPSMRLLSGPSIDELTDELLDNLKDEG